MKKTKLLVLFAAAASILSSANAAITVSIKNFTSLSAGVAIVDTTGKAVSTNTVYASAGIFTTEPNWATATASDIIAAFTAIDSTPVANSSFTGAFTANDTTTLASYATGFESSTAYILVGNASTLANSTLVAVYKASGTTYTPTSAGVANVAINGTTLSNWVYGKQVTVTTAPSVTNNTFGAVGQTGIALTSVPEPSAALLGLLGVFGLARRRR